MNHKMNKIKFLFLTIVAALSVVACNDPWKEINGGSWNHEHSIIAIEFEGQAGLTEITNIDEATGTVGFKLMSANVPDMTKVAIKTLTLSYGATANVEKGSTLDFTGSAPEIAVSSPNGDTRVYTLNMSEFSETLIGMYKIQKHMHYGGTGPEYGGGALMDPQDKSWVWDQKGFGPKAEYDNYFEIVFETINAAGNSVGRCIHYAGVDGKFWNAIFQAKYNKEGATDIDLHKWYRLLPMGTSTWERNYSEGTITFTDAAGKKTVATLMEAGSHFVFNSNGTTDKFIDIPNLAFNFALTGVDDWTNIYGDYDKFAKKVRNHYILFEAVESIPAESKTEGTEGDITIAPPPVPVELAAPKIALGQIKPTEMTFSWGAVENSSGYAYTVTAGDQTVDSGSFAADKTTAEVFGLTPESVYTVSLKAVGDGNLYLDSQWTEISITTPEEAKAPVQGSKIEGSYLIGTRWVFTGPDGGNTHIWNYNDKGQYVLSNNRGYWKDDVLVLTSQGVVNGIDEGEADYQPGADKNYWDYLMKTSKDGAFDRDCSDVYKRLPHGKSTYRYDEATGIITFTQNSVTVEAKMLPRGNYTGTYTYQGGRPAPEEFKVTATMALDFAVTPDAKGETFDPWGNYGWAYYSVHNLIIEFNLQQ